MLWPDVGKGQAFSSALVCTGVYWCALAGLVASFAGLAELSTGSLSSRAGICSGRGMLLQ